jgi:hypothetical protein
MSEPKSNPPEQVDELTADPANPVDEAAAKAQDPGGAHAKGYGADPDPAATDEKPALRVQPADKR